MPRRTYSPEFNPITSSKTKLVELLEVGPIRIIRIYRHTSKRVYGNYIAVLDELNWIATDTIEEAREKASAEWG